MRIHDPTYIQHTGEKKLVVFIHGFMGSPAVFQFLMQVISQRGYSALSLLLPGHGGTVRDFIEAGLSDWESHVARCLYTMASQYDEIVLVGHSMGGLLALCASMNQNFNVSKVALLSAPLGVSYFDPSAWRCRVRFLRLKSDHIVKTTYKAAFSISRGPLWVYPLWIRPLSDLYALMRKTKQILPDVRVPVLLIQSKNDEVIARRSMNEFFEGLANTKRERVTLNGSWHSCILEEERDLLAKVLLDWIARNE